MTISKDKVFSEEVLLLLERAEELLDCNLITAAIDNINSAIELNGRHPYLFAKKGFAELCAKEYNSAINDFDLALNLKKDAPLTLFYRAQAKENIGDIDGALQDYENSALLDATDAEVFSAIGMLYEFKKNYPAAEASYKTALNLDSENDIAKGGVENIRKMLKKLEA